MGGAVRWVDRVVQGSGWEYAFADAIRVTRGEVNDEGGQGAGDVIGGDGDEGLRVHQKIAAGYYFHGKFRGA